jgi:prepilin-type processing-associated H-X9-DG protein
VGPVHKDVYRRSTDVTDGTSNTFLVVEDAGRDQCWVMDAKLSSNKVPPCPRSSGSTWADAGHLLANVAGFDPAVRKVAGPCGVNCFNGGEIYSFHAGGANVAMADVSVRFLNATVSVNVVLYLITRQGEEVIPGDAF